MPASLVEDLELLGLDASGASMPSSIVDVDVHVGDVVVDADHLFQPWIARHQLHPLHRLRALRAPASRRSSSISRIGLVNADITSLSRGRP